MEVNEINSFIKIAAWIFPLSLSNSLPDWEMRLRGSLSCVPLLVKRRNNNEKSEFLYPAFLYLKVTQNGLQLPSFQV